MDSGSRQRVVGAAVLAALGVIFVPAWLQRPAEYEVDQTSKIPERPEFTFVQQEPPVKPEGLEPPPTQETLFIPDDSKPEPVGEMPVEAGAAPEEPEVPADAIVAGLDEQGLPKSWVVQVASFKEPARAQTLVDELRASEYRAYQRSVEQAGGAVHRVYVGPSINRNDAVTIKQEIDSRYNLETLLLRFSP